jgi:Kdo2-lipid IVA lauroyltransferase/acyltransferase
MWFFRLISFLPFWILYGVSDFLAWLAGSVFKYRREVILQNLRNSFPEKTDLEIAGIERAFYLNLSDVLVESLKTLSLSKSYFDKHITIKNAELCAIEIQSGRGVIVLAAHQANWEWTHIGYSAITPFPILGVYRPLHNIFFDRLMLRIRSCFGSEPLAADDVSSFVKKNRDRPYVLALVADQTPLPRGARVEIFLNQPTAFFRGPEMLAALSGWKVIMITNKRIKRGHYQLEFHPIIEANESPRLILPRYAATLEASIRANPSQWLWSHRRWKHSVQMPDSP